MKKIKFTYGGETEAYTYKVPQSYNDVTLEMQIAVTEASKTFKTDTGKKIAIIAGYCGMDPEKLARTPINDVVPLFSEMGELFKAELPKEEVFEFEFEKHKYYVAQNLMEQEFQDYISLETILTNNENDVYKSLPKILGIMCKRKDKEGKIESLSDYNLAERAAAFNRLPIQLANGVAVFFYRSVKASTIVSQLYSNPRNLLMQRQEDIESTLNKRDGMGWLSRCQTALLRIWMRYILKAQEKHFPSSQSKSSKVSWRQTFMTWLRRRRNRKDRTFI